MLIFWKKGRDSHKTPKETELVTLAELQRADSQDRLKYLSGYAAIRLTHLLFYSVAIVFLDWNYFGLLCATSGTALHLLVVCLSWRWDHVSTSRCWPSCVSQIAVLAPAMVIDAGLVAMTRIDVQHSLRSSIKFIEPFYSRAKFCDEFETLCRNYKHAESFQTTQIFQFVVLFFIVFVLNDSHSLPVAGLSVFVYSSISVIVPGYLQGSGPLVIHSDLITLAAVYAASVIAKSKMAKSKRMLIDVLEKQSSHVVQEKVLRCQAEFTCEQLASRAAANQHLYTTHGAQDIAAHANPDDNLVQFSEVPLATEDDVFTAVSSYPETATYSGPVFKQLTKELSQNNLTRLSALAYREFWLIHSKDLKVETDNILGTGGFGIVHAASYLGTPAAVKVAKVLADKPNRFDDLVNELRILRRLRHPNIVLFLGACVDPLFLNVALVLEKVQGKSLDQFCIDTQEVPIIQRCHIVLCICRAICYIHGQSPIIVHGDLKPSNIMVSSGGFAARPNVKLLDFGLSRLLTKSVESLGGTIAWMAPEVLSGHCRLPKPSVDVFSLARVSYLVLVGRSPVEHISRNALMRMATKGSAPPLVWPEDEHLYDFQTLLSQCIMFQPDSRPTVFEVHAAACLLELQTSASEGAALEPASDTSTDMPKSARLAPLEPTSAYAKFHTVADAVRQWNTNLCLGSSCCRWHAALRELEKTIQLFKRDPCWESFSPFAEWQCKECGLLQEHAGAGCRICAPANNSSLEAAVIACAPILSL